MSPYHVTIVGIQSINVEVLQASLISHVCVLLVSVLFIVQPMLDPHVPMFLCLALSINRPHRSTHEHHTEGILLDTDR